MLLTFDYKQMHTMCRYHCHIEFFFLRDHSQHAKCWGIVPFDGQLQTYTDKICHFYGLLFSYYNFSYYIRPCTCTLYTCTKHIFPMRSICLRLSFCFIYLITWNKHKWQCIYGLHAIIGPPTDTVNDSQFVVTIFYLTTRWVYNTFKKDCIWQRK